MSFDALRWAIGVIAPHSRAKLILIALANFVRRGERKLFASLDTLGGVTQLERKTITRGLRDLEQAGLIVRTAERRGRGGAPVFELQFDAESRGESGTGSDDGTMGESGTGSEPPAEAEPGAVSPRSSTSSDSNQGGFVSEPGAKPPPNPGRASNNPGNQRESTRARARSRRCPTDFVVTDELRQWARQEFPDVDVDRETEAFRDWEFKRAYSDWPATWRNWIRKAKPVASPGGADLTFKEKDSLNVKLDSAQWGSGERLTQRELRYANAQGIDVPAKLRPIAAGGEIIEMVSSIPPQRAFTAEEKVRNEAARVAAMARLGRRVK